MYHFFDMNKLCAAPEFPPPSMIFIRKSGLFEERLSNLLEHYSLLSLSAGSVYVCTHNHERTVT